MFNRLNASLKGALSELDARFAEEQARSRQGQPSPAGSNPIVRRQAPQPSSTRPSRSASSGPRSKAPQGKGPDPGEFETDFVIDDEDGSSRSTTPAPRNRERETTAQDEGAGGTKAVVSESTQSEEKGDAQPTEPPQDVRARLRKLERLEFKYGELLRSYRIAHARVTSIEAFEGALREITPLTSINDPGALSEYLNQLNLKGDMVLDELKRVSNERTEFKKRLEEAEKSARDAWDEVARLKVQEETPKKDDSKRENAEGVESANTREHDDQTRAEKVNTNGHMVQETPVSPVSAARSPPLSSRMPRMSLFSPKQKPVDSPKATETSEDLFSYDNELPRVEAELKQSLRELDGLRAELKLAKGNLATAQESTQSMAENIESTTRELNSLRDVQGQCDRLMRELEDADAKMRQLETDEETAKSNSSALEEHKSLLAHAEKELKNFREADFMSEEELATSVRLQTELDSLKADIEMGKLEHDDRIRTSEELTKSLKSELYVTRAETDELKAETERLQSVVTSIEADIQSRVDDKPDENLSGTKDQEVDVGAAQGAEGEETKAGSKKNKKKKKKGGQAVPPTNTATGPFEPVALSAALAQPFADIVELRKGLEATQAKLKEKDATIERLQKKIKDVEELQHTIEVLEEEVLNHGSDRVEAADKIKELLAERTTLQKTVDGLQEELTNLGTSGESAAADTAKSHSDLTAQFEEIKAKAKALETDLIIAQRLATSRFKDLSEVRAKLQKAQPELNSLRTENRELKSMQTELDGRVSSLQSIQVKHDTLQDQLMKARKQVGDTETETRAANQKLSQEQDRRQRAEEGERVTKANLRSAENESKQLSQTLDRISKDLLDTRQYVKKHEARVRELEEILSVKEREQSGLQEEIQLKGAQYASAESLMTSMRDQTSEMATQLRESRERCDSLEEEVADAHRLLNERTREGETMRRLLAEVETRTDSRVREMRDRMDAAIDERERMEDEASTSSRRRTREVEEARSKLRDAERDLRTAEEARVILESAQRDWKRQREDLEHSSGNAKAEAEEVKKAMGSIRDALDESDKSVRALEKQKGDLRKALDEAKSQLEKLQRSNKTMSDEVRSMEASRKANEPRFHSPETSVPPSPAGPQALSPVPVRRGSSAISEASKAVPATSTEYLKTILLQFLQVKEKKHQMQLVPTLGTLLHFDAKDQEKWTAAIMAK